MTKITVENTAKIHTALLAVNGRAKAHTFTTFSDIDRLARVAEKRLDELGIPKASRGGAVYHECSGGPLANAYQNSAIVTVVQLIRRSGGWYLDTVAEGQIWGGSKADNGTLTLTAAQDAIAVEKLRRGYSVQAVLPVERAA